MVCGVYMLKSSNCDKVYIGSSVDTERRFAEHIRRLNSGKHHSKKLQDFYFSDKLPTIEMEILKRCKPDDLGKYEKIFIKKYDSVSNGFNATEQTERSPYKLRFSGTRLKAFKHALRKSSVLEYETLRFQFNTEGIILPSLDATVRRCEKFLHFTTFVCKEYPTGNYSVSSFNYSESGKTDKTLKYNHKRNKFFSVKECDVLENNQTAKDILKKLMQNKFSEIEMKELFQ